MHVAFFLCIWLISGIKSIDLAPKSLGDWKNDGKCVAKGPDPACGAGTQNQRRTCTDGTVDKCTEAEKQRTVVCTMAGTQLPACNGN